MQPLSAALMTVAARWYAASAAEGMPLVEAVCTILSVLPEVMPRPSVVGSL